MARPKSYTAISPGYFIAGGAGRRAWAGGDADVDRVVESYSQPLTRVGEFGRAASAPSRAAKADAMALQSFISGGLQGATSHFGGVLPVQEDNTTQDIGSMLSLFNVEHEFPDDPVPGSRRGSNLSFTPAVGAEAAYEGVKSPEMMASTTADFFRNKGVGVSAASVFAMRRAESGLLVPDTSKSAGIVDPEYAQRYMAVMRKANDQLTTLHQHPQELLDQLSHEMGHAKESDVDRRGELAHRIYTMMGPQYMREPTAADNYDLHAHGYHIGAMNLAAAAGTDMSGSDDEVAEAMHRHSAAASFGPDTLYVSGVLPRVVNERQVVPWGRPGRPERVRQSNVGRKAAVAVAGRDGRDLSPGAADAMVAPYVVGIGGVDAKDVVDFEPNPDAKVKIDVGDLDIPEGTNPNTRAVKIYRAKQKVIMSKGSPTEGQGRAAARWKEVSAKDKAEKDAQGTRTKKARSQNVQRNKKTVEDAQKERLGRVIGVSEYLHDHESGTPQYNIEKLGPIHRANPDWMAKYLAGKKDGSHWIRVHYLEDGENEKHASKLADAKHTQFMKEMDDKLARGDTPPAKPDPK